ncbi:MAG TPA: SCO family protein [Rhodocyclaceae bacterium]|nr:SCO family protein [Rhodocyclaceae bacterium]
MSQRLLLVIAIALGALVIGLALLWEPGRQAAPTGPVGGDFTLHSGDGPVSLAKFRGKVVLLNFGYTYCPDICPTALTSLAAALNQLAPAEAERVAVLFVSVDPERDTPAHLKDYVAFFDPRMVGLTGTPAEVAAVARQYGVFYAKHKSESAAGYVVDHSSETYLIGPDGSLLGRIPHATAPDQVAAEIRKHLDSK